MSIKIKGANMQVNRLFEIVYILLEKKKVTANELAEHFEVSKRTILRDIDALTIAGIPIYTSKGKGGGISILDNFVLNKTTISDEEQSEILMSLQSLAATKYLDDSKILSKLETLFQKTDTNWIEVDFSRWNSIERDKEKFELLKNAIIKKQAIAFTYASSYGETTERTVHPLKLVFKSKAWYLQGYCLLKNDYRTFKINRMLAVEMLNKNFSDKQYEAPLIDSPDVESTAMTKVVLKVAAHMAYRAYDEFDEDSIARNDDGTLTITANLPQDEWLYNFILSFGTAMRIIEPRQMRDELLLYAVEVKDFYLKG